MTLVMLLGNLLQLSTKNQLMLFMQPSTLCDHLHYTNLLYTAYSSHLRIIGLVGQQNKTKINKRKQS